MRRGVEASLSASLVAWLAIGGGRAGQRSAGARARPRPADRIQRAAARRRGAAPPPDGRAVRRPSSFRRRRRPTPPTPSPTPAAAASSSASAAEAGRAAEAAALRRRRCCRRWTRSPPRRMRFEAPVNKPVRYKTLIFMVRACETTAPRRGLHRRRRPCRDRLRSRSRRTARRRRRRGRCSRAGCSPTRRALDLFQHPVYDAWLIACKTAAPSA